MTRYVSPPDAFPRHDSVSRERPLYNRTVTLPVPTKDRQQPRADLRVFVAQVPGAASLVSRPGHSGLVWAGRFSSREAALASLIRRALAIPTQGVSR